MPSGYLLKFIPEDVYKFIVDEQNKIKRDKGVLDYGFGRTIYKMLRDYKKCREENNFKPPPEE